MSPTTSSLLDSKEGGKPPDTSVLRHKISPFWLKEAFLSVLREFYEKNGNFDAFKDLQCEIVSEITLCHELWQEFSPQKTLFDTWEFRFAFYLGYKPDLHFILLKNQKENLALLPLWYEADQKKYFWFGSSWQEENRFFTKNPGLLPILLSLAPSPIFLNAIGDPLAAGLPNNLFNFQKDDSKYVLNLKNLKSAEDYLTGLKKNSRHDLRKDKRRIEKQNPEIIVDRFSDIENLIKLSKERFKQKGLSTDWEDERRAETFRQVIKLTGRSYKAKMIAVSIGGKIAGVDLIALFNNCYYAVKCGYDVNNFSGIGNFFNILEIEDAISLKMDKIDFLQNNYQWKARWFEQVPLLKYEKAGD